jgi:hypothetical protein
MRNILILLSVCIFIFFSVKFAHTAMVSGETAVMNPVNDATVWEGDPDLNENSSFLKVYAGVGETN